MLLVKILLFILVTNYCHAGPPFGCPMEGPLKDEAPPKMTVTVSPPSDHIKFQNETILILSDNLPRTAQIRIMCEATYDIELETSFQEHLNQGGIFLLGGRSSNSNGVTTVVERRYSLRKSKLRRTISFGCQSTGNRCLRQSTVFSNLNSGQFEFITTLDARITSPKIVLDADQKIDTIYSSSNGPHLGSTKVFKKSNKLPVFRSSYNLAKNSTQSQSIFCGASGNPPPFFGWRRMSDASNTFATELQELFDETAENEAFAWSRLAFPAGSLNDSWAGRYICQAANSSGNDTLQIMVNLVASVDKEEEADLKEPEEIENGGCAASSCSGATESDCEKKGEGTLNRFLEILSSKLESLIQIQNASLEFQMNGNNIDKRGYKKRN